MKTLTRLKIGRIANQRIVTFKKPLGGGRVLPSKYQDNEQDIAFCLYWGLMITPAEKFRRWKIARKAWATRKNIGAQLRLGL